MVLVPLHPADLSVYAVPCALTVMQGDGDREALYRAKARTSLPQLNISDAFPRHSLCKCL